jgi:hypothetical protein
LISPKELVKREQSIQSNGENPSAFNKRLNSIRSTLKEGFGAILNLTEAIGSIFKSEGGDRKKQTKQK